MIELPSEIKYIIRKLSGAGYEGYAVGGCVRDSLLGRVPTDWDVAASAEPRRVMAVFKSDTVIPTGIKHGTVTIIINKRPFEVTTYRIDGNYSDGRRPDRVGFTDRLAEDLSRRDFTINAMAYNDERGLVDIFGGKADLERRLIRCVGEPKKRFGEDYLRMIRAYRFACVLGFDMEESLIAACKENLAKIKDISAERIRAEFEKIITSDNYKGIELFFRDFSAVLFPEIEALFGLVQNNYSGGGVFEHTMAVLEHCDPEKPELRLSAVFHDTGLALTKTTDGGINYSSGHEEASARIAKNILLRLKFDNKTINTVTTIVRHHVSAQNLDRAGIRRLIYTVGYERAALVLEFVLADVIGKSECGRDMNIDAARESIRMYEEVCRDKDPCELKALAAGGSDIQSLSPDCAGKAVGEILGALMDAVLENPHMNTKEKLMDAAREIWEGIAGRLKK